MTEEEQMRQAARLFGRMGGKALKEKRGSKYLSELGKKGMAKRWANHKKKTHE